MKNIQKNTSTIGKQQYNLVEQLPNSINVYDRLPTNIPTAIKKSIVLWYDIEKQGATNKSLAANPILKDLSGNGHDMELRNFSWSGMSGVGGYGIINLSDWIVNYPEGVTIINDNKLKVKGNITQIIRISINESTTFKLSVKGATQGNPLYIRFLQNSLLNVTQDGVYDIELNYKDDELNLVELGCQEEITIEQLPLYLNALVSDGVDDYGYVDGLPSLTRDKGYTIFAKRKWIKAGLGALCSKNTNNNGAFQLERVNGSLEFPNTTVSFDQYTSITVDDNNPVVYQTVNNYNGILTINTRDVVDTNSMTVSAAITNVYERFSSLAIYSLILFDRDLTDEEIEWVKHYLLGKDFASYDSSFNSSFNI